MNIYSDSFTLQTSLAYLYRQEHTTNLLYRFILPSPGVNISWAYGSDLHGRYRGLASAPIDVSFSRDAVHLYDVSGDGTIKFYPDIKKVYITPQPSSRIRLAMLTNLSIVPASGAVDVEVGDSLIDIDYQNSTLAGMTVSNIDRIIDLNNNGTSSLNINPSTGTANITVNNWLTSGTYYKNWTESNTNVSANTAHTIGDLEANTYYTVNVAGSRFCTYLSNGSGQITFTYNGGYSTKTFEVTEDTTPPTNINISSISADSPTQLTITAQTATDSESGLDPAPYWFNETSGNSGASSSVDWQASTAFTDSGLAPNTQYSYQVKAKDAAGNQSSYSSALSKYTLANIPSAPALSNSSSTMLKLVINQNSNPANTLYAIQETSTNKYINSATGALDQTSEDWQTYTTFGGASGITITGLSLNTQYTFKVKAKNGDNVETTFSPTASLYTSTGNTPANFSAQTIGTASNTLTVDRFTNDTQGSAGYLFANATNSHTSGWIQVNSWIDMGLTPNTSYAYTVKYRSAQGVESSAASLSFYTLANISASLSLTADSSTQITASWSNNSNPNATQYYIENTTNNTNSGWITNTQ